MKPIDPRLLRYARATRFFLAAVVGLGALGAGLVIAQAMLVAEVVVGAFQHGESASALRTPLVLLVAVAGGRALVSWLTELAAHRAGAAVKSELRGRLLERAARSAPAGWAGSAPGRWSPSPRAGSTPWTTTSPATSRSWGSRWWCRWRCWRGS